MDTKAMPRMTPLPSPQEEQTEEALSEIFECHEAGLSSETEIAAVLNEKVRPQIYEELKKKGLVIVTGGNPTLSDDAARLAEEVIRRKRLAERLLKDVLNVRDELIDPAACQWEHILSKEVTNSICTLLGHPSQSPRHMRIPSGECCRKERTAIKPVVRPLDKLSRGEQAKVVYLLTKQGPDLQRLLALGLVPGTVIEVLQRFPTFVVQAGESQFAFDEKIAESIFVHPF